MGGESGGLVGEHRAGRGHGELVGRLGAGRSHRGLAGAGWDLRDLPAAGDLPPLPPQHCPRGSRATGAGAPGGAGGGCPPGGAGAGSAEQGGLSPPPRTARPRRELQDRFCRVSPGPPARPPLGPLGAGSTASPPPGTARTHRGDTAAPAPPAGIPRVGRCCPPVSPLLVAGMLGTRRLPHKDTQTAGRMWLGRLRGSQLSLHPCPRSAARLLGTQQLSPRKRKPQTAAGMWFQRPAGDNCAPRSVPPCVGLLGTRQLPLHPKVRMEQSFLPVCPSLSQGGLRISPCKKK